MAGEATTSRPQRLVVLDFDGVLVDLRVNRPLLEQRLQALFAPTHSNLIWRPLLRTLNETLAQIAERDVQQSQTLRKQAWQIISELEWAAAEQATLRDGVREFFAATEGLPKILYSNNDQAAVKKVLQRLGIAESEFIGIVGRTSAASLKPAAEPLLPFLKPPSHYHEIFFIGDHPYDMQSALMLQVACNQLQTSTKVVPIGLFKDQSHRLELEQAGGWFFLKSLRQSLPFLKTLPSEKSLSLVYLAYNEAISLAAAVEDARRFCGLYLPKFEVIIVDDGSTDATSDVIKRLAEPRLRSVAHARNLGMGAGMQSGYELASSDYMAHLPADRQVRPQMLIEFLPYLEERTIVLSLYQAAPLGWQRALMSALFRFMVQVIGGLHVDVAGTYIFHRSLLPSHAQLTRFSRTFLFSFEILQYFKQAGAAFRYVTIAPFYRDVGTSREANTRRILKMLREIVRSRLRR